MNKTERSALERAEFLLRRIATGDHQALANARSGANQARRALRIKKRSA